MDYSQFTQFVEAKKLLEKNKLDPEIEKIQIDKALGRIIAKNIFSKESHPSSDISAMDGFVLNSEKTEFAQIDKPVILPIQSIIQTDSFEVSEIDPDKCARIDTGAKIPDNGNAVVMIEEVDYLDDKQIILRKAIKKGDNIIKKSSNVAENEIIYEIGQELFAQDIAFLFSQKIFEVSVYKQFIIGLLVTGDELTRDPSNEPEKTLDTTSLMLKLMITGVSSNIIDFGIVKDEYNLIKDSIIKNLNQVDILIITGGTSKGTKDYTASILNEIDISRKIFHFLSIKPGKPFGVWSTESNKVIFLLPGPPAAGFITYEYLIKDFINNSYNFHPIYLANQIIEVEIRNEVKSKIHRRDFLRVKVFNENGSPKADLIISQSSSNLSSLTLGNGIIEISEDQTLIKKGSKQFVRLIKHVY